MFRFLFGEFWRIGGEAARARVGRPRVEGRSMLEIALMRNSIFSLGSMSCSFLFLKNLDLEADCLLSLLVATRSFSLAADSCWRLTASAKSFMISL